VVVGSTTFDKNIVDGRRFFKIGGVTTYAGITYSRHGVQTTVVTNIAECDRVIHEKLRSEKIVVQSSKTKWTTHFVNKVEAGVRRQEMPKRAAGIRWQQVAAVLNSAGCVHLGPLHPLDIDMEAIGMLGGKEVFVVLDLQGYVRALRAHKVYPEVSEHLSKALRASHLVKGDEAELRTVLDSYHVNLRALMKRFKIEEFLVTQGPRGGFIRRMEGGGIRYQGVRVEKLIDPTGAGDVFLAAYVYRRVFEHEGPAEASAYAAQLAARQIEGDYITTAQLALTAH
jgi:sugar/nucleoside kinase (ribokinase family)